MNRLIIGIFILAATLFGGACKGDTVKVFRQTEHALALEGKEIPANSGITEVYNIDSVGNRVPDQIFATATTDVWNSSLPSAVWVSFGDSVVDKVVEYWDVSFAEIRNGGNVVFTRTIINNDSVDRVSYAWNILLRCRYIKY